MPESERSPTRESAFGLDRILVATDLTAYSDRAFDRAVMLAEENHASLHFLHVIDPGTLPESYVKDNLDKAKQDLERDIKDSEIGERLDISLAVGQGEADEVILEEARKIEADLIVMGLSHDVALTSIIRGTTIDKVVRAAHCPVLVVKTRARRAYEKITAAIDLAEPSRQALDIALHAFSKADYTIVHADEFAATADVVNQEWRHQIEDLVAARFAAVERDGPGMTSGPTLIVEGGKASEVLQRHVGEMAPDLVVLGTHGRTGVSKLFLGSVAETLLETLPHDVLVARASSAQD